MDFIADGREQSALDAYWKLESTGPLERIGCASMDMWRPFINSASAALPLGDQAISNDPFHIVQHVNQAMDSVRRQEQPMLDTAARKTLKGTRFMWLYGLESLPAKWTERMAAMKDGKTRTGRAWCLKEIFRSFFECGNWAQAEAFFKDWYSAAMRSRLDPIKKVARMIKDHLPQVLNYFVHRVTNVFSEGMNSRIQRLIKQANGCRNRKRLKRDLYSHLGNLDMLPIMQ